MKIVRTPLRSDIYAVLLGRLLRGEFPPGTRFKDTVIAEELGVSRTPVREALIRLAHEGYLEATMGKGFTLRPMTFDEVEELYPILWTLEAFALRQAAPLPAETYDELDRLAAELEKADLTPEERIDRDDAWHRLLLSGFPNATLHAMIAELKTKLHRYEFALMEGEAVVATSVDDHRRIGLLLREEGPGPAAEALERHWRYGLTTLLEQLQPPSRA